MPELHFLRPDWLWSLLPAVLVWWGLLRRQDTTAEWRRVIEPHLLEHLLVGKEGRRRLRPIHLTIVLWVLSALALAGPSWEREPSPFADDQAGLVVLFNASATMDATDVQPSRIERSRHKLSDLLELRQGAATGLIAYSGSAHLVMPLTRDGRIINAMASELDSRIMPLDGDALADALLRAGDLLDRAGVAGSVVVMADAVSPAQVEAVEDAAPGLPVQFLVMTRPNAPLDFGLEQAAKVRGAAVTRLSIDSSDVEAVAGRAETEVRDAPMDDGGERWKDGGYLLLPLIALVALAWSRRGWVVS